MHLDTVNFDETKLLAFICNLNINKAHEWDDISTRMLKICDDSIVKPLMMIFQSSLNLLILSVIAELMQLKTQNITSCIAQTSSINDLSYLATFKP